MRQFNFFIFVFFMQFTFPIFATQNNSLANCDDNCDELSYDYISFDYDSFHDVFFDYSSFDDERLAGFEFGQGLLNENYPPSAFDLPDFDLPDLDVDFQTGDSYFQDNLETHSQEIKKSKKRKRDNEKEENLNYTKKIVLSKRTKVVLLEIIIDKLAAEGKIDIGSAQTIKKILKEKIVDENSVF